MSVAGCATAGSSGTVSRGLGLSASTTAPIPQPASPSTTTPTSSSPTTAQVLPIATVPAACGGVMVTNRPVTPALDPLLLTAADIPAGYTTSGPARTTTNLLFGDELPASVPVAAITFSVSSGPTTRSIGESLAREMSAPAASDEAQQREDVNAQCGYGGTTTVALPGPIPHLVAITLLGGQRGEDISSAEVYAARGPYLLEVSWDNVLDTYNTGVTGSQPALPSPAVMGSVVDAALVRIPG
jgi:hypothetical protein